MVSSRSFYVYILALKVVFPIIFLFPRKIVRLLTRWGRFMILFSRKKRMHELRIFEEEIPSFETEVQRCPNWIWRCCRVYTLYGSKFPFFNDFSSNFYPGGKNKNTTLLRFGRAYLNKFLQKIDRDHSICLYLSKILSLILPWHATNCNLKTSFPRSFLRFARSLCWFFEVQK